MDFAAGMMVPEEVDGRQNWDGVLFIVDPGGGHLPRIDIVGPSLVTDLRRHMSLGRVSRRKFFNTRGDAYPI